MPAFDDTGFRPLFADILFGDIEDFCEIGIGEAVFLGEGEQFVGDPGALVFLR